MPIVREDFKTCRCGNKEFRLEKTMRIGIDAPARLDDSLELPVSSVYSPSYKYICVKCNKQLPT